MAEDIRSRATLAFFWSFAQSWLVKVFSLLVFFVLARVLSPQDMGLAQAVTLVLAFVAVVGEFGFHSALVQQRQLECADVNLPFFLSLGIALLGSALLLVFAEPIARALEVPAAAALLRVAAAIPPLTASTGIVVALFRRELDFAAIARAGVAASLVSGSVAIALALAGFGAGALVAQALVSGLVTAALIWRQSSWRPNLTLETRHFRALLSFSSFAFASSLLDFLSSRLLDVIIVGRFGLIMLGMYAVGAKLYQTLMELLASALTEVSTSMMSRLQDDPARLRRAHLRLLFLGSCSTSIVFVWLAALAPELCRFLFGHQWEGAAGVATVLCLLGSLGSLQYFNTAVLLSHGRSRLVFFFNLARFTITAVALSLAPVESMHEVAICFACAQLLMSPIGFGQAIKVSGASWGELAAALWPAAVSGLFALGAVILTRPQLPALPVLPLLLLLSLLFVCCYAGSIALLRGKRLRAEVMDIWQSRSKTKGQAGGGELI